MTEASATSMPDELSPRHLRTRLLQLGALAALAVVFLLIGPGVGTLRDRLRDASAGWLALAVVLEFLSSVSYVVVFRAVFCPRMSWKLSYQIGMAEQAANSLLPAGGAGGLALGAWALRRGGMAADHIGRRTVAFFLLTSIANVWTLVVFALLFAVGVLHGDKAPGLTYGVAGAGVVVTIASLLVPLLSTPSERRRKPARPDPGRVRVAIARARAVLGAGIRDAVQLLRQRSPGVLIGSFGYMAFDIAVLWASFRAFGGSPPVGVLVVAYLIGQLGGLIPLPGGIGGIEGGLIGTLALYDVPLTDATVAVLAYRTIALWLPALLGSLAFTELRSTLQRQDQPAAMCGPLIDPLDVVVVEMPRSAA